MRVVRGEREGEMGRRSDEEEGEGEDETRGNPHNWIYIFTYISGRWKPASGDIARELDRRLDIHHLPLPT
jgi:hypothetical protein